MALVIGIFGESCTGKSAIAKELSGKTAARVFTGKDYMRLAKNEADAKKVFSDLLNSGGPIIYVISEKGDLSLLPEPAFRVLVTAGLDLIKERFAARMNGTLPPPVAAMIEKKHGMFDKEKHDLHVRNGGESISAVCDKILSALGGVV